MPTNYPKKPFVINVKVVCLQGRNLSDDWGACLFIYSCYARRVSFEINLNSKETRRAEHEYMNKHPPPPVSVLVTSLSACIL